MTYLIQISIKRQRNLSIPCIVSAYILKLPDPAELLHTATLINNTSTNVIDNNAVSGLLINDISDHLPVLTISDCNYKKVYQDKRPQFRRIRTEKSMNALKNNLLTYNCESIYDEKNVDKAYDECLRILKLFYDKKCPIIEEN